MKFSVLISVYDKEEPNNLKQALQSIINQSRKPNQIVIIKDGKLNQELDNIIESYLRKISKVSKSIWI